MELRIDRALILAHSEKYLHAFQVLMPRDVLPTQHEELDIVARLYVKTGDLEKARFCLKQAVSKAPHIRAYRDTLAALDKYIEKECRTRIAALKLGIITLIVCIVSLFTFTSVKYGTAYLKRFIHKESVEKKVDSNKPTNSVELPKSTKPNQQ